MSGDYALLIAVIVGFLLGRLTAPRGADNGTRLEAKLDALMQHSGARYEPLKQLPADVKAALLDGNKIEAIKRYRAHHGGGLKEAKDAVDLLHEEMKRQGLG